MIITQFLGYYLYRTVNAWFLQAEELGGLLSESGVFDFL